MTPLLRRTRFLAKRRAHGRLRPKPQGIVAGNCMSVSTSAEHARAIFTAYLDVALANDDVTILLSECAKFRAQKVANDHHPGTWRITQHGTLGSPESAVCIVERRTRTTEVTDQLRPGSRPTSEGGGIRNRPILHQVSVSDPGLHGWTRRMSAGHAPPSRAPIARAAFLVKFAAVGGTKGGDLNLAARVAARLMRNHRVQGFGVICLATPRWIPATKAVRIPAEHLADADHDGVRVTLWPTTKEN